MWRVDATAVFGMLTGIVLGLGFFALIAYLVYLFVYKRIQMKHEMRLEMIKQGVPLPVEKDSYGSLKAGIVTAMVGLAFLFGFLVDAADEGRPPGGEVVVGMIPLFVGIGLIISYMISKRANMQEMRHDSYSSGSSES